MSVKMHDIRDFVCAYHEAGHAVMAVINGLPIKDVRLDADGGCTRLHWWARFVPWHPSRGYMLRNLEFILGGLAAEALVTTMNASVSPVRYSDDDVQAERIARVQHFVLSDVRLRVYALMKDHPQLISAIAGELLEKRILSGDTVRQIGCRYFNERPTLFPLIRE